ncbi:MAG: hypothetical protein IT537_08155 [Hyphomicrobiales bacterium]|nr:hypothetical protein [Hyphomicrobiales bacterium]
MHTTRTQPPRGRMILATAALIASVALAFEWYRGGAGNDFVAHAAGPKDSASTVAAAGNTAAPKAVAERKAVQKRAAIADYERARWDPIHFKPAIDFASNEACLACHQEVLTAKPRAASPAGVKAGDALAWYQTLDSYNGPQASFHWRHLQSPFAKQVMNLSCNFCHQGSDPRESSPHVTARNEDGTNATNWRNGAPAFTLRKTVNPVETCLRCHGGFPAEQMGLSGGWHENREALETAEAPNGCLSCHGETFRTVRHRVNYLKAAQIEKLAKSSSDTCFGCHGGRQWYRISYPYPRHRWPGMPEDKPDWANDRPTESDPRFRLPAR